jgi:hypothetical protein
MGLEVAADVGSNVVINKRKQQQHFTNQIIVQVKKTTRREERNTPRIENRIRKEIASRKKRSHFPIQQSPDFPNDKTRRDEMEERNEKSS